MYHFPLQDTDGFKKYKENPYYNVVQRISPGKSQGIGKKVSTHTDDNKDHRNSIAANDSKLR